MATRSFIFKISLIQRRSHHRIQPADIEPLCCPATLVLHASPEFPWYFSKCLPHRHGVASCCSHRPRHIFGNGASGFTYTVTFEGNWNRQSAPASSIPSNAYFTQIIYCIHNSKVSFWEEGSPASLGVEVVAEIGSTFVFNNDCIAEFTKGNVRGLGKLSLPRGGEATASKKITFDDKRYPLFTFMSMLGPTPDWFVGTSGLSLLDSQGNWVSSKSVNLFAYDAGTETGTGYTLNNPAEPNCTGENRSGCKPISSLMGKGKFSGSTTPIAKMTFTLDIPANPVNLSVSGSHSASVTEGSTATITATLNSNNSSGSALSIPVKIRTTGTTAQSGDYMFTATSISIANNQRSGTATLTVIDDSVGEPPETVIVELGNSLPSGISAGTRTAVTLTLTDNDATVVSLARSDTGAIAEGGTGTKENAEFTVSLARALAAGERIDVPLALSGNGITTTDLNDLAEKVGSSLNTGVSITGAGTLTPVVVFQGANARTATLVLTPTDDSAVENDETLSVALGPDGTGTNGFDRTSLGTNVGGGANPHGSNKSFSVTLESDDVVTAPVVITISAGAAVTEGRTAEFTVTANPAPTTNLTVALSVSENTADGQDFVAASDEGNKTVVITSAQPTATYTVATVGDDTDEPNGSVTVTVKNSSSYTVGSPDTASVTVTDNDNPPVIKPVVSISASGTVTEGGHAEFTVTATPAPATNLTVDLSVSENTADGQDFVTASDEGNKTVVIASAQPTATYTVATVEDDTDEPNGSVTVMVKNNSSYTVGSPDTASVTVTDNDGTTPPVTLSVISFESASQRVPESEDSPTVTVKLNPPSQSPDNIMLNYRVSGTAEEGEGNDFTIISKEVMIAPGVSSVSIRLWIRPDTAIEDNKNVILTLISDTSYTLGSPKVHTLTIIDDDTPDGSDGSPSAEVMLDTGGAEAGPLAVNEGTTTTYTVVLTEAPRAPVTVTPTSADPEAVSIRPAVLTFGPTDWERPQSVTVTGMADADADDETVPITHEVASPDVRYAGFPAGTMQVTVADTTGPAFVSTRFAFTLAENLVGPAPVRTAGGQPGTVHAAGAGSLTYTLAADGGSRFRVDPATGVVTYVGHGAAPGHYELTVQATDARGRVAEARVTVEVRDAAAVARLNRVQRTLLPEAARLAAGRAFAAVSGRLESGRTAARLQVAGDEIQTPTVDVPRLITGVVTHGTTLAQALAGSEFVLPLSATGDSTTGGLAPVLWGSVDWTALSGSSTAPDWNGGMLNAHLGADVQVSERLLAGVAVSHARGTFDWTERDDGGQVVKGTYKNRLTSLMPYLGWTADERLEMWAAATLGRDEVTLDDAADGKYDSVAAAWSAGAGARGTLLADGPTTLALKGEAWVSQWAADSTGPVAALDVDVQRLRLALEGKHAWTLASGAAIAPSLEVGVRHDGGAGETGTGLELGGGVHWNDPARGLTVQARARTLLGRGGYRQWGVAGLASLDPGADGLGLALSIAPAWGAADSGLARLWNEGMAGRPTATLRPEPQLEATLGYGVVAPGIVGTVTPYAGLSLAGAQAQTWRTGARLNAGAELDAHLETTWRETIVGAPDLGVTLEVEMRF